MNRVRIALLSAIMVFICAANVRAGNIGTYSVGQLVPLVYTDGGSIDTVVGITVTNGPALINWNFYDADGRNVAGGQLQVPTRTGFIPFSWEANAQKFTNEDGYLIFTSSTATIPIAANALYVDSASGDAVFIPVTPTDIKGSPGSLTVAYVDTRYWIDPEYQASTQMVYWTNCDATGSHMATFYSDNGEYKDLFMNFTNKSLNVVDPSSVQDIPSYFINGFNMMSAIGLCASVKNPYVIAFSLVSSNKMKATQTLLGEIR